MGALGASRRALAVFLFGTGLISGAAAAETPIKFSLDFKLEGPAAPFLVPLDKGYYKAEGVNVEHRCGDRLAAVDRTRGGRRLRHGLCRH